MEKVLDVYKRPYDEAFPVVCMDESPKQLIGETRIGPAMKIGKDKRVDYEYVRKGTCNVFMVNEPLSGKRRVEITERKTKLDWAELIKKIADDIYPDSEKITLVMDNLNTHKPGALYERFDLKEAKRIWDRFEFVYNPKHGSWLNMTEIELHVLNTQCLNRRINSMDKIISKTKAWQEHRNNKNTKINWQFTTDESRIRLKKLYPSILD